jgi:hypothetical protein
MLRPEATTFKRPPPVYVFFSEVVVLVKIDPQIKA